MPRCALPILWVLLFMAGFSGAVESWDYSMTFLDRSGKKIDFSAFKGKPVLILYHSLSCSKCKAVISRIREWRERGDLEIAGIVSGRDSLKAFKADTSRLFPDFFDKDQAFKKKYKLDFTPAFFVVNAKGELLYRQQEVRLENLPELLEVLGRMARGATPYSKVMTDRYYGDAVCAPCHPAIHAWWDSSAHAKAYGNEARIFFKGGFREDRAGRMPAEILRYCTVGFGESGGYDPNRHTRHLLGVQCESCHTAAGPHDGRGVPEYETQCVRCHTTIRDPSFLFRSALHRLNHPKDSR